MGRLESALSPEPPEFQYPGRQTTTQPRYEGSPPSGLMKQIQWVRTTWNGNPFLTPRRCASIVTAEELCGQGESPRPESLLIYRMREPPVFIEQGCGSGIPHARAISHQRAKAPRARRGGGGLFALQPDEAAPVRPPAAALTMTSAQPRAGVWTSLAF